MENADIFQRFQEATRSLVITVLPGGAIHSSNAACTTMLGWEPAQWIGKPIMQFIHKEDAAHFQDAFCHVLQGIQSRQMEVRVMARSGRVIVLNVELFGQGRGGWDTVLCIGQEVTARVRAEMELRACETRLHDLLESTRAVPFEADYARHHFTYVGPQAVDLLGYPIEDWYKDDFWQEHVHPDDLESSTRPLNGAGNAADEDLVYRMRRSGGDFVWVLHISRRDHQGRLCRGFLLDVTARHQALQSLERSREQHRALAGRIQTAREEERLHVAREIHDELGQTLTGIRIDVMTSRVELASQLSWEETHPLLQKLQRAQQLVEEGMRTVRRIATELRPPILDNLGLLAAVEWLTKDFRERYGITCSLDRTSREPDLEVERATAVFRIVQEVLTNVARHAQATAVTVLLRQEADHVLLRIEDNGRGVNEADLQKPRAFGVLGMQERATAFGGELIMARRSAGGTRVTVRLPVELPQEAMH